MYNYNCGPTLCCLLISDVIEIGLLHGGSGPFVALGTSAVV